MIFLRNAVYTTVCCLSLVLPSLVHADAPVVDPTADYNSNNSNSNPDAADYAGGSSNQNAAPNNAPPSNNTADNSSSNNGNSSSSFPSAAQPAMNQAPSDNNDSSSSNASMSLDERVAQLERQLAAMNQLNLLQQVNQLQQQVQDLTGQLEDATHSLQMLQNQQKNQYADLDQRLSHLENPTANKLTQQNGTQLNNNATANPSNTVNSSATTNNNSAATTTTQQQNDTADQNAANNSADQPSNSSNNTASNATVDNSLDEQQAYQKAYNLIKNKDYTGATNGMAAFVKQYPNSNYALNAHYWLGEMYLLQNMPGQAATEFHTVISNYPQNPKTGDAMLKLGFAYADEQKWTLARKQLMLVQTRFADTATGQLAAERLKEMKLQGH